MTFNFNKLLGKQMTHVLDDFLRRKGFWQRPLSKEELTQAIMISASFYRDHGLTHFAEAIEEFHQRVYLPAISQKARISQV